MLYSRPLLFTHSLYKSLRLLTPISHLIPPLTPCPGQPPVWTAPMWDCLCHLWRSKPSAMCVSPLGRERSSTSQGADDCNPWPASRLQLLREPQARTTQRSHSPVCDSWGLSEIGSAYCFKQAPGIPWWHSASTSGGTGSIPGQGTKSHKPGGLAKKEPSVWGDWLCSNNYLTADGRASITVGNKAILIKYWWWDLGGGSTDVHCKILSALLCTGQSS